MKFKQHEDGSCDIIFTNEEVEVISKNKKLHMTSLGLRHFGNNLIKIVVELNALLPEKDRTLMTYDGDIDTTNDSNRK